LHVDFPTVIHSTVVPRDRQAPPPSSAHAHRIPAAGRLPFFSWLFRRMASVQRSPYSSVGGCPSRCCCSSRVGSGVRVFFC